VSDFQHHVLQQLSDISRRLQALEAAEQRRAALDRRLLPPLECAVVDALGDVFGAGTFKSRDVEKLQGLDIGDRPALRAALAALLRAPPTRQRLGIEMARMANAGGRGERWRLTAPKKESGGRLWCIEALT
jgi:hypothetical protein